MLADQRQPTGRFASRPRWPPALRLPRPLVLGAYVSRAAAYLAGQQLIRGRRGERGPCRDHPADQGRLGHRDIGGQAGDAARDQQGPRKRSPLRPDRESASNVVDAATIIPSTENGVSAATQPGCPYRATSMCR